MMAVYILGNTRGQYRDAPRLCPQPYRSRPLRELYLISQIKNDYLLLI